MKAREGEREQERARERERGPESESERAHHFSHHVKSSLNQYHSLSRHFTPFLLLLLVNPVPSIIFVICYGLLMAGTLFFSWKEMTKRSAVSIFHNTKALDSRVSAFDLFFIRLRKKSSQKNTILALNDFSLRVNFW